MFAGKGRAVWDTVMSGELREMLGVGELALLTPSLSLSQGEKSMKGTACLRLRAASFLPELRVPNEAPALEFFAVLP